MNRRVFLMGVAGAAGCARDPRPRLNVYNWSAYVAPDTIPNFEDEFGVRVRYATYESNEEMLAKVLSGNSGWDVVFPTHNRLQPMRENGLLAPLRHDLLPESANLAPHSAQPVWDPRLRMGRAVYVVRGTGIVITARWRRRPRPGPISGGAAEGPADDAGRSGGHAGRVPEEAASAVQRHRSGGVAAGRAGGEGAEASAARLSECRGAGSGGCGRCAGGAVVVDHGAAGDRRGAGLAFDIRRKDFRSTWIAP